MQLNPFCYLADVQVGGVRYALRAWMLALVPSLAVYLARVALGAVSPVPQHGTLDLRFVAYSILIAPVVETALMLPLAWLVVRVIPDRKGAQIVALATSLALAHAVGGGWAQAVNVFWPFLVYSAALLAWWPRSRKGAFALTAVAHALYNATFFALVGVADIVGG